MKYSEAAAKYNWIKVGDDDALEFYCDNTILSEFRNCQAYFVEARLNSIAHSGRAWSLEFGTWFHKCMELFYLHEKNNLARVGGLTESTESINELMYPVTKGKFIAYGLQLWDEMDMDYFKDKHKNFKILNGNIGAASLLSDYWTVYGNGQERLRVIGMELPFGRAKEVPIIEPGLEPEWLRDWQSKNYHGSEFRAYLTGRVDLMVDDLVSVSVIDHKTTAFFDGSESLKFIPNDGQRGYCYAANQMVQKLMPDKRCNRVLINHVCITDKYEKTGAKDVMKKDVKVADPQARFTRTPITYTPEQLEEYLKIQQATFVSLYEFIINERPAQWNTNLCNNMYYKECPYKAIHGTSPTNRQTIVDAQYKKIEEWTPFHEDKKEIR